MNILFYAGKMNAHKALNYNNIINNVHHYLKANILEKPAPPKVQTVATPLEGHLQKLHSLCAKKLYLNKKNEKIINNLLKCFGFVCFRTRCGTGLLYYCCRC
jgi:hypothetical protein